MTITERSGISRRDIIKKGAIAGAVFWSVPVIESVTSAASATSATGPISCSWAYIVYAVGGQIYVAGYSNAGGQNNCASFAANPDHGTYAVSGVSYEGTTYTFYISEGSPGGPGLVTYETDADSDNTTGPGITDGDSDATALTAASDCNTYLSQSGTSITAQNGATLLAYFYFGGTTGLSGGAANGAISLPANC